MKLILESYQDVENFLRSPDLYSEIVDNFGKDFQDYGEDVCQYVVDRISEDFDTSVQVSQVVVCKVVGEDVDMLDTEHSVVSYNGFYYDYTASIYNDSFNGLIGSENLPVVQPIIKSDNQINERLSTIKGYVLLGY